MPTIDKRASNGARSDAASPAVAAAADASAVANQCRADALARWRGPRLSSARRAPKTNRAERPRRNDDARRLAIICRQAQVVAAAAMKSRSQWARLSACAALERRLASGRNRRIITFIGARDSIVCTTHGGALHPLFTGGRNAGKMPRVEMPAWRMSRLYLAACLLATS